MTIPTIREYDDDANARLRTRAARHGRSMEEEARTILYAALGNDFSPRTGADLVADIRALVKLLDGIELALPPRMAMPAPYGFGASKFDE